MSTVLSLTERDHELLQALVQKVRLFSLRQLALNWWDGQLANARRRLKQLAAQGLVNRIEVTARTLPSIRQPIIVWHPADVAPNFDSASYQFQKRWDSSAARPCTAFVATERLSRIFGGQRRGDLKHPLQATHDLGVAEVWLHLCRTAPACAGAWRNEDILAHTRRGEKCPDAFIMNDHNEVVSVIEFGGAYSAERVRAFHDDCAERGLPYQMW